MRINDNTKVEDLGYLLRINGYSFSIEYGSGGYTVTVIDNKSGTSYVEASNNLVEAIKKAFIKAQTNKIDFSDEKTDPGTPIGKKSVSLGELSKMLSSGTKKKVKF